MTTNPDSYQAWLSRLTPAQRAARDQARRTIAQSLEQQRREHVADACQWWRTVSPSRQENSNGLAPSA